MSAEGAGSVMNSIDSLSLQHYPGMTESLLEKIVEQANQRWNLIATTVIHRVGDLVHQRIKLFWLAWPASTVPMPLKRRNF